MKGGIKLLLEKRANTRTIKIVQKIIWHRGGLESQMPPQIGKLFGSPKLISPFPLYIEQRVVKSGCKTGLGINYFTIIPDWGDVGGQGRQGG